MIQQLLRLALCRQHTICSGCVAYDLSGSWCSFPGEGFDEAHPHFVKAKVRIHQSCDGTPYSTGHNVFPATMQRSRNRGDGEMGRFKPLGAEPVDMWAMALALSTCPQAHQQQQKRSIDGLTCYLHFYVWRKSGRRGPPIASLMPLPRPEQFGTSAPCSGVPRVNCRHSRCGVANGSPGDRRGRCC